jgi:hypothetical protein
MWWTAVFEVMRGARSDARCRSRTQEGPATARAFGLTSEPDATNDKSNAPHFMHSRPISGHGPAYLHEFLTFRNAIRCMFHVLIFILISQLLQPKSSRIKTDGAPMQTITIVTSSKLKEPLSLDLLAEDVLEGDSVSSEFRDTLAELLDGHLVLVEVEAELGLVVDVALLLEVERVGAVGVELLGDGVLRVVKLLEQVGGNGEVVASSELSDLADAAERGTHDDGLVAELLVVVENVLDRLDTGVLLLGVLLLGGGLVPVKDTANEGRNEESAGLSSSDGLDLREHEGEVGVDSVLGLEDLGGLDALPCRCYLDENALLADTLLLVQLRIVSAGQCTETVQLTSMMCRALFTEASVSKEKRASTSVETFPGMILRISFPNWTRRLSNVASTCSSMSLPCFLPYSTAASISLAYSSFLDAARIKEGLVVASWGWYLAMVAKSPESQTTTCAKALIIIPWCLLTQGRRSHLRALRCGEAWRNTYGARGLQLIERVA